MKSATVCYNVRCDSFYYYFTDLNTASLSSTAEMTSPLPLALACFSILLVRGAGTMRLATHMLDETRRCLSPLLTRKERGEEWMLGI